VGKYSSNYNDNENLMIYCLKYFYFGIMLYEHFADARCLFLQESLGCICHRHFSFIHEYKVSPYF
jgi:hypothetical protein